MEIFICPICRSEFIDNGKSWKCTAGHNFDKSKKGYVNLLIDNKSKRHGDDKLMIKSRHEFLRKGYYQPLFDSIVTVMEKHIGTSGLILDAGCGEGWYTTNIAEKFPNHKIAAVDISKDALAVANLSDSVVASVYDLPIKDKSVDMVLNIFSPFSGDEYRRVLTDNGVLIYVIPLENHLYGLKSLLYDKPYPNEVKSFEIDGFSMIDKNEVKYTLEINDVQDIKNLFSMTPYYYTTGINGHNIINSTKKLSTPIEFCILTYRIEVV